MCISIADKTMLDWLRNQQRVMVAWSDELSRRSETDIEAVERLARHQDWLKAEIERLETLQRLAA